VSDLPPANPALPILPPGDGFDPASQSLADALRKSFAVLKALMLVLVVAYVLSGWFRVQPGEVGFVVRMGRVVGEGSESILRPGWHWSFPYPIDQVVTVATQQERTHTAKFLFRISDEDRIRGVRRVVYSNLSPIYDNYLLTGDVSILHAQLQARYRIVDPVTYVTNVTDRSPEDSNPPEYEVLHDLLADAAIRTAARLSVDQIYGAEQEDFLNQVTEATRANVEKLTAAGVPLGIEIVAVIAPQQGEIAGILAPRQVQEQFDAVVAAQQNKNTALEKARAKAGEELRLAAGPGYEELATAIESEFDALLDYLRAERATEGRTEKVAAADAVLRKRSGETDALLFSASGRVQEIINQAKSERERIINETLADAKQIEQLAPEYLRNSTFLLTRLQTEFVQRVVADDEIIKTQVPLDAKEYRLEIPRESESEIERKKPKPTKSNEGFIEPRVLRAKPERN